ncbi:MAG: ATP-binding cassette domain-containing protein [bacterium]|nr:ATP-binding cassette domain-containing protein [bacterium]
MAPLLEVKGLKKYFKTPHGMLHAVDDVSFSIEQGTTLGIVGESGCGKSTLGRVILHLLEPTGGQIFFEGRDITTVTKQELHELRKQMQIIFQDPYSSINPRMTVREIIAEPMQIYKTYSDSAELNKRVQSLMDTVGLARRLGNAYPHELDGGRRQRIGVARALSLNPKFIVCDEPVSALDVSIQAQIINLLQDLQEEYKLTYIFITHDLSVVRHISTDIGVMYLGQMVEKTNARELFNKQLHPYTRALLSAIPRPNIHDKSNRIILKGEISTPIDPADECRFSVRCNHACERCREKQPALIEAMPNHFVACERWEELCESSK